MTYRITRGLITLAAALGAAITLGGAPVMAAGTLTVNCTGSDFATINAAVGAASAGSTIKVCAGTYNEAVSISSLDNLKLIASGQVILEPFFTGTVYNGPIIKVSSSHNVTIQGFVVNGAGLYGPGSSDQVGISFMSSSGRIVKNNIINIRHNPQDGLGIGPAIQVTNGTATILPVTIQSNTISAFQRTGIDVSGNVKLTVSKNMLSATSAFGNTLFGMMLNSVPGGKISGNTILFDGIPPGGGDSTGIWFDNTSKVVVSGNKISEAVTGISLNAACGEATNSNRITGNTIRDASTAIKLATNVVGICPAGFPSEVKTNQVASNRLYDTTLTGAKGIVVEACCATGVGADADGNLLKSNTVYGYLANPIVTDGTDTTRIGNKINLLPPPGF